MAHTLLLAEPSLTIQRVVQLTFANEDIDIVVANDGAEAMALAERLHPAVVLADVSLGRHDGYEVTRFIRRHPSLQDVRVVLLSGAFERVDHERASEIGCDLVLAKPFDPVQLLSQVKDLIGPAQSAPRPEPPVVAPPQPSIRPPAEPSQASDRPGPGFLTPGFTRDTAAAQAEPAPPVKRPADSGRDDPFVFRRSRPEPSPGGERPRSAPPSREPAETVAAPAPEAPAGFAGVEARPDEPQPGRDRTMPAAEWLPADSSMADDRPAGSPPVNTVPRPVHMAPAPVAERVPSFEMLALTNKGMHLVPAHKDQGDDAPPPAPEPGTFAGPGHDLGNLIPALDDYFDQMDAAFATNTDLGFRRPPDVPPVPAQAPPPMLPSPQLMPPPSAPVPQAAPIVEERGPAVSPFSNLRREEPPPAPAPEPSVSIDDAYDALMKQLRDPKPRSSVVALRADDELLVERAVERVLERLDPAAVREAMEEVITSLAKRVIREEIERIRRP